MGQITLLSGPERRRWWSVEERRQILEEAFSPGACVAHVARRYDISTGLIYTWRSKFRQAVTQPDPSSLLGAGFAEAVVVDGGAGVQPAHGPAIIVELSCGNRVSIFASASPALTAAVLKALR